MKSLIGRIGYSVGKNHCPVEKTSDMNFYFFKKTLL